MHMLYHVSDIDEAIREIARVIKPDGLVLISANSTYSKPALTELKAQVAKTLGRNAYPDVTARFNIESGLPYVQKHFAKTEVIRFVSQLELTTPKPYVDYFDSTREFWQPKVSDSEWKKALFLVQDYMATTIKKNDGIFREPNIFGIILALVVEKL